MQLQMYHNGSTKNNRVMKIFVECTCVLPRDGPDSSFAGYPAILKTGYRPDIRWVPDTGYFNACLLFNGVTQIIETSQIFKQE